MPRTSRLEIPGGLYHVMTRGIERRKIFNDDEDRKEFLRRFEENLTAKKTWGPRVQIASATLAVSLL